MNMIYQIDQSGKIEDTAKNTVIAYSNKTQRAILIPRKVKRQVQEAFRLCGANRLFIYYTFAAGVYFLIKNLKEPESIVIDLEYCGKDKIITSMIEKFLISENKPKHILSFRRIGNRPKAHYAAKDVFDGKKKADDIVSYRDLIRTIKKTDGRLRECLSTLVGVQSRSVTFTLTKKGSLVKK